MKKYRNNLCKQEWQNHETVVSHHAMNVRKKLAIGLVIVMLFALVTPIPMTTVFAGTTDTLTATFDPRANISIEIGPQTYDFGNIWANSWRNTTGTTFTIFNNGSVAMDTDFNVSGNATNFTLDNTGACSSDDEYGVQTNGLDTDGWLDTAALGGATFDQNIADGGSKSFDLYLKIGGITQNFDQDTFTITVQGSVT